MKKLFLILLILSVTLCPAQKIATLKKRTFMRKFPDITSEIIITTPKKARAQVVESFKSDDYVFVKYKGEFGYIQASKCKIDTGLLKIHEIVWYGLDSEIVWCGLDFSHIKLNGKFSQIGNTGVLNDKFSQIVNIGIVGGTEIKDKYFKGWNDIIVSEPDKYNLPKTLNVQRISYDLDMIKHRNALMDADNIFVNFNDTIANKNNIENIVSSYGDLKTNKGIGCVFIMSYFNKETEVGAMWVTFFDIATKKTIYTKRLSGQAFGYGIKRYWIHTVYEVFNKIQNFR